MAEIYMRNIRDWRDATLMLSFEERGYFDEIISLIYLYDGCLPDDDDLICRAMPVNKKVHLRLKNRLVKLGLIQFKNGRYFNSRSTQELLKINSISTQNRVKAAKRWAKSLENNKTWDATADTAAMLKVNSESEVKELSKDSSKKPPRKNTNGHRIEKEFGKDWRLPEEYLAYAVKKGFSHNDAETEFEKFTNYWQAKSGSGAIKRSWIATWRSWMLNACKWKNNNGGGFNGPAGNGVTSIIDITAKIIAERDDEDA